MAEHDRQPIRQRPTERLIRWGRPERASQLELINRATTSSSSRSPSASTTSASSTHTPARSSPPGQRNDEGYRACVVSFPRITCTEPRMHLLMSSLIVATSLVILGTTGCSVDSSPPRSSAMQSDMDRLQREIDDLRRIATQVKALRTEVDELNSKAIGPVNLALGALDSRLTKLEDSHSLIASKIVLNFASKSFTRLATPSGVLFVSVQDAQPYLDGYKVFLDIGNPSNASLVGGNLEISWGPKPRKPIGSEDTKQNIRADWFLDRMVKTVELAQPIRSGSWNKVELILTPAKAADLELVEMSATFTSIGLATAQRQ